MTLFRLTSLIEGLSFLVILSVTLGMIPREYVFPLGMTHGVLFLLYLIFSLHTSHKLGWSVIVWLLVFFAATVPFAFIAVDLFLQKEMKKAAFESTAVEVKT